MDVCLSKSSGKVRLLLKLNTVHNRAKWVVKLLEFPEFKQTQMRSINEL